MIELIWTIIGSLLALATYLAFHEYNENERYKHQGIHYFGNGVYRQMYMSIKGLSLKDSLLQLHKTLKKKNQRFSIGAEFRTPSYFIIDLELIKKILVKDFDHFVDRKIFEGTKHDRLIEKMIVAVRGDKWRSLRATMSPTFTTGKIKRMFHIFNTSGKNMSQFIYTELTKAPDDGTMDLTTAFSKNAMDVIASAAFGIDSKAFDQSGLSVFEEMGGKLLFSFDFTSIMKLLLWLISPKILNTLGLSLLNCEAQEFFSKIIKNTIQKRKTLNEKRDDFLQLLLEARDGKLRTDDKELGDFEKEALIRGSGFSGMSLDDDDIVAQSLIFIVGGFDTIQSLDVFAVYNLAIYPEIQEKLFQEVEKTFEQNDNELSYESVNKMQYMDMFLQETMRYYPPAMLLERTATKEYKIPDSNIVITKGSIVKIPIIAIQRDEKYFPNPSKCDPERFSPEKRSKIHSCAFAPFGHGPRNCIGMRFALMEVKVAIAHLVHNFILEPSEKTPIPMTFLPRNDGGLSPEGGMWLRLRPRR